MGWGIAGGVLGIILMFGAYKWATSWASARSGGVYVPTIGSRPRRLAGVPEEAPADARMPPAMEVLRYGEAPVVVPDAEEHTDELATEAPAIVEAETDETPEVVVEPVEVVTIGEGSGIIISEVFQGGEGGNEHVVIANTGPHHIALESWRITDEGAKNEHVFAAVVVPPGAVLRLHMWAGQDTETDVYVGRRRNWWNDGGDNVYLYDASGVLVHSYAVNQRPEE